MQRLITIDKPLQTHTYNTAQIRQFLQTYFNDADLDAFAFDYFPDVYEQFSVGMIKGLKIQLLLDSAVRYNNTEKLLAGLKRDRPYPYESFFSR
jgi:hypothetical protein